MKRVPIDYPAVEFRGRATRAWVAKDGGSKESTTLKFEYDLGNDDVLPFEVDAYWMDRVQPPLDHAMLTKGDVMAIRGEVVVREGFDGPELSIRPSTVAPAANRSNGKVEGAKATV